MNNEPTDEQWAEACDQMIDGALRKARGGGNRMRGIIFDAESVRAILAGEKTQTRRLITDRHIISAVESGETTMEDPRSGAWVEINRFARYQPGEIVYVKEGWQTYAMFDKLTPGRIAGKCLDAGYRDVWGPVQFSDGNRINWDADLFYPLGRKRSPLHMPEWASRIRLQISEVGAERLQDISEADVCAEGLAKIDGAFDIEFEARWDAINRRRAPWESNPFVFVYSFSRLF